MLLQIADFSISSAQSQPHKLIQRNWKLYRVGSSAAGNFEHALLNYEILDISLLRSIILENKYFDELYKIGPSQCKSILLKHFKLKHL